MNAPLSDSEFTSLHYICKVGTVPKLVTCLYFPHSSLILRAICFIFLAFLVELFVFFSLLKLWISLLISLL